MDLIKSASRRTRFSEIVYIVLNLLLPVVLFVFVKAFDSALIPIALVILSKWRILAVRPRYWLTNLKTNAVDIIVGISFVGLLFLAAQSLVMQLILVILYAGWLIYIKPKSRRHYVAIQAGIGQFVALTALFSYSWMFDVVTTVFFAWLVSYIAARHVLGAHEEEHIETISLGWALLMAELAWFCYHWTLSYPLFSGLSIPQFAALSSVSGFAMYNLYDNYRHKNPNPLRSRLTIGVGIGLLVIILVFSRWDVAV